MDLKAALEFLVGTGKATRETKVIEFPNDPDRRLLIKADGTHEALETPRQHAKRNHKVATIVDFVAACAHLVMPAKDAAEASEAEKRPSPIWFDARSVVVFPDDRYRDERITLALPESEQLQTVAQWEEQTVLSQPELVRVLRHDLLGCVDPSVLLAYRTVNFQVLNNAARVINHGAQSMDKDIAANVVGAADKPQQFYVNLPLFNHRDFRGPSFNFSLLVTIDIDAQAQNFKLQIAPGDYARAIEQSAEYVRIALSSALEGATLIAGVP